MLIGGDFVFLLIGGDLDVFRRFIMYSFFFLAHNVFVLLIVYVRGRHCALCLVFLLFLVSHMVQLIIDLYL